MKKLLHQLLFTLICFSGYSQIKFEKGYFIDNFGQKTECLIKNIDWKYNPDNFDYKLTETGETLTGNLKMVSEFGINNSAKFIRSTVKMDKSSDNLESLNYRKAPIFEENTLFLRVLVEGKYFLYLYENGSVQRFFYTKENKVEQLIYKRYLISENEVGKNEEYKQQLFNNLKCTTNTQIDLENLEFKKKELILYFLEINKCNNSTVVSFESKTKQDLFNLSAKLSLNQNSLSINTGNTDVFNFRETTNIGFGLEAEVIFPFNKNKWSVFLDPVYQKSSFENTIDVTYVSGGKLIGKVDYNTIEVPIGLRHYLFINNKSKVFLNAVYIFDYSLNSKVEFRRFDDSIYNILDINPKNTFGFGFGFKYLEKFSGELRFKTSKNILDNYLYWNSDYKSISIIIGYTIF